MLEDLWYLNRVLRGSRLAALIISSVAFNETVLKSACDIVISSKEREDVSYEKEYMA